ncbi:hypothetical protein KQX54_007526 [Cotesia glomerata]|uniref:Uncharacterized protein n=1 Tax=Cotesia glomerata TaxID=32391 RepID=A0AAV7IVH7_COTGL|nr:hypothetical protein KQX54_007526 [Cotesia glomerata]
MPLTKLIKYLVILWEEKKPPSGTPVVVGVSLQDVASLLSLTKDDSILASTSREDRKPQRPLWRFYSTRMLTHSHSDGEFPIYSQGKIP